MLKNYEAPVPYSGKQPTLMLPSCSPWGEHQCWYKLRKCLYQHLLSWYKVAVFVHTYTYIQILSFSKTKECNYKLGKDYTNLLILILEVWGMLAQVHFLFFFSNTCEKKGQRLAKLIAAVCGLHPVVWSSGWLGIISCVIYCKQWVVGILSTVAPLQQLPEIDSVLVNYHNNEKRQILCVSRPRTRRWCLLCNQKCKVGTKGNFNPAERKGNAVCTLTYFVLRGTKAKGWSPPADTSVRFSSDICPRAVWDPTAVLDGMHLHHGTWKPFVLSFLDLTKARPGWATSISSTRTLKTNNVPQYSMLAKRNPTLEQNEQIYIEKQGESDACVRAEDWERLWRHGNELSVHSAVSYKWLIIYHLHCPNGWAWCFNKQLIR